MALTDHSTARENRTRGLRFTSFLPSRWGGHVNVADCTFPEKILLAAHQLEGEGQTPFSAEALIVGAWKKFPMTFGLKGYAEQYPDSNKILSALMGERGLARRGWLAKVGQKLYSLSREGRGVVERLLSGGEAPPLARATRIGRDLERQLLALLEGPTLSKFLEGRRQEMTFADACRFWGIPDTAHGEAVDARLNKVRQQLTDFERLVGTNGLVLSNGRSVSAEDVAQIRVVHEYLRERFGRHLNLLRSRAART